jgi:phenylpropionate dioxygenase-like ring-hydroxylating dioxygenase large terminal subunit
MFINFWYPTVLASELADKPVRVRILGQDLAVFRDSQGRAHCLSNVCPHRGGSLAGGRVRGDQLQCPYHGWEFSGAGECRRIPSLGPEAKIPARTGVDSYPVLEKYGIVFAFLGDLPEGERPPLLEIPEFDREGWRASWMVYDVDYNYERSVENGLDPAHNEFVHPSHGFSGEREGYRVNDLRWVGSGEWGPGFFHVFRSPPSKDADFAKMKQASDSREAGTGAIGPNQIWTYIRFGAGKNMHQYMYEAPIDETRTKIFLVNLRSTFLEPEMDQKVNAMNWNIASQDITVLKDLDPVLTPDSNTKEFMVPADEPILRYRQKLGEWTARGWRIDTSEVERLRRRTAFAIPSPARRERKGWVLDPVPLVAAGAAAGDELAAGHAAQA